MFGAIDILNPERPKRVAIVASNPAGRARVDVTFSLPDNRDAQAAADAGAASVQGCTLSGRHEGYWEGEHEWSFTISRIGQESRDVDPEPIVAAVIAAGCTAVQVERWNAYGDPYRCEEWRAVEQP